MKKEKFIRADLTAVLTGAGLEGSRARKLTALIIEAMGAALAAGKAIELRGLGTLEPRERIARSMHNPRTMAAVDVPARKTIFFRPSGELKRAINGRGEAGANE